MNITESSALLRQVDDLLVPAGASAEALAAVLDLVLDHFECVTGTIHRLDAPYQLLMLAASRGIPDVILEKVQAIPIGKGMAGLAAERRECVQVCNLQTDESGTAKPAARLTAMAGSIAAPMLAGDELRGTIGIAKPQAYEFTQEERELLLQVGSRIAEQCRSESP